MRFRKRIQRVRKSDKTISLDETLRVGDTAVVTGDIGVMGHGIEAGGEVTLERFDPTDQTWLVRTGQQSAWVDERDLRRFVEPVTDRELKATMKSIQQSAKNLRSQK